MTFDFSHLYKKETVSVTDTDGVELFQVTVKQVSHADKENAKAMLIASVDIPLDGSNAQKKSKMQREIKKALQGGVTTRQSLAEEVASIHSWTLVDSEGNDVPVCVEAWQALPSALTIQVAEVIERLNPSLDSEFRNGDGSESTTEQRR